MSILESCSSDLFHCYSFAPLCSTDLRFRRHLWVVASDLKMLKTSLYPFIVLFMVACSDRYSSDKTKATTFTFVHTKILVGDRSQPRVLVDYSLILPKPGMISYTNALDYNTSKPS